MAQLTGLLPGTHDFEVKAKDSWLNEDATPAEIRFELPELAAEDGPEQGGLANCNCASSTPRSGAGLAWGLLLAGTVVLRRRRTA